MYSGFRERIQFWAGQTPKLLGAAPPAVLQLGDSEAKEAVEGGSFSAAGRVHEKRIRLGKAKWGGGKTQCPPSRRKVGTEEGEGEGEGALGGFHAKYFQPFLRMLTRVENFPSGSVAQPGPAGAPGQKRCGMPMHL